MSRLSELLEELCPDGVEYKKLGEIAEIIRGNGLQKSDFVDSGVGCIHYGQIYTKYGAFADKTITYVTPELAKTLKTVSTGDLVVAITSENVEDVCKCVAWLGGDDIVTGGHAAIVKHKQNPKYLSYIFQTVEFFRQKRKYVIGTKVIEMSPKKLAEISIPVPPLAIQNEIVKLLDNFTELTAELTAELQLRKKQYSFYRDSLLNFASDGDKITIYKRLSELAEIGTGSSNTNEGVSEGTYPFFVRSQEIRWKDSYEYDETAVITSGDGVGVGKIFHYIEGKYALHQRAYRIHVDDERLLPKFLFYYMKSTFYRYITKNAVQSSVTSIRRPMLDKYPIPIPPLETQAKIVSILDRFDALCHDLTQGLPAEIAARKKQYEYYRDKLLTFPRKGA